MGVVIVVYLLTSFARPLLMFLLRQHLAGRSFYYWMKYIHLLIAVNSCSNIFIYVGMVGDFREGFLKVFLPSLWKKKKQKEAMVGVAAAKPKAIRTAWEREP